MRKITITRYRSFYAVMRLVKLYIDGEYIGSIKIDQSVTIKIPDGAQEMYGRVSWGRTKSFPLNTLRDGDKLAINGWMTFNVFKMLGFVTIPMKIWQDTR